MIIILQDGTVHPIFICRYKSIYRDNVIDLYWTAIRITRTYLAVHETVNDGNEDTLKAEREIV